MPIVETRNIDPEREVGYSGPCVIFTLESILGQLLGKRVVAPTSVFDVREAHVIRGRQELDRLRGQFLGPANLWGMIGKDPVSQIIDSSFSQIFSADPEQIIGKVIPAWIETDPQLAEILRTLQFDFIDASFNELVGLAKSGLPVGVVIHYHKKPYYPVAHIFHLGAENDVRFSLDLSDFGSLRQRIHEQIFSGEIGEQVEAARRAAGFSGLVVRS